MKKKSEQVTPLQEAINNTLNDFATISKKIKKIVSEVTSQWELSSNNSEDHNISTTLLLNLKKDTKDNLAQVSH